MAVNRKRSLLPAPMLAPAAKALFSFGLRLLTKHEPAAQTVTFRLYQCDQCGHRACSLISLKQIVREWIEGAQTFMCECGGNISPVGRMDTAPRPQPTTAP